LSAPLSTGFPVAIEQDIAMAGGKPVVSHKKETTGEEPTLRAYFFERVRPIMEMALARNDRSQWPIITVHFDFKDNQRPFWKPFGSCSGEYEAWVTTASKSDDPQTLADFDPNVASPTEDNDQQEEVFFTRCGGREVAPFGSAHTARIDGRLAKNANTSRHPVT